jgi:hypothetical protein
MPATDLAAPKILMCLVAFLCLSLQGCGLNSVRETRLESVRRQPPPTLFVYGVGQAYVPFDIPFGISIEQYDPVTGNGGDCWRWNHAFATAPKTPDTIAYHVFEAPSGAYAYAWNNGRELQNPMAFTVAKGKTVYLGEFILQHGRRTLTLGDRTLLLPGDGIVEYRRNLVAAKAAWGSAADLMELAPTIPNAPRPRGFVCTP